MFAKGARRHWEVGGGHLSLWKCCKVFCALVVTVGRLVDQLFVQYLYAYNFLEGRSGSVVHLVVLACVLRATTKKRSSSFFPTENPG